MITGGRDDSRLGAGDELSGRYTLISEIGRGGTGTVWRADDRAVGREVAVKVLHQRLGRRRHLVSGFVQQRIALTGIEHPHIVRIYDLVFDDGVVALVSELIEGQTLRRVLRRGLLRTREAVAIGGQLASALARLHVGGVVHCDVKPENILLAATPDHAVDARLADLGTAAIAREIRVEGSGASDVIPSGTPGYLPPEAGGLDPPTPAGDVYALGVVLYEIATGRGPAAVNTRPGVRLGYHDDDAALAERFRPEEPATAAPLRIPDVPRPLWRTVGACLRADPAARPKAAALAEHLATLGRYETSPAVAQHDGVPTVAGGDHLGWPTTLAEPEELPTPVQEGRRPEVVGTVAPDVASRWIVGLPPIIAGVLATVLVTGVGAVLQRSWSTSAPSAEVTSAMPVVPASAATSAERYFAPTGWICTAPTPPRTGGDGTTDRERRNDALRLCIGLWDGVVHVNVHTAGAETAAPKLSTVPSTSASPIGRSDPSRLGMSVPSVKVELRSIVSTSGSIATTKVFICDLSRHANRNRCDVESVATHSGLTYMAAAYLLPAVGGTPSARTFPKTPALLTPMIQNGRSQDHDLSPEEPEASQQSTRNEPGAQIGRHAM